MDAQSWLRSIFGVLGLLAVVPALWVAKGLLSHLVARLRQTAMGELAANQTVQLILWLALGGLFTKPLLEILGWIQALEAAWLDLQSPYGLYLQERNNEGLQ